MAERRKGTEVCASAVQPPKFDGNISWAVFRRQFENAAEHNCWTHQEKFTYLIIALKGRATNVLQDIPTSATYEDILQALKDSFGDLHFAAAYHSQLKIRTQRAGQSLQEFSTAIEHLAHHSYPILLADHMENTSIIVEVFIECVKRWRKFRSSVERT
jgi:hypothetical protein